MMNNHAVRLRTLTAQPKFFIHHSSFIIVSVQPFKVCSGR